MHVSTGVTLTGTTQEARQLLEQEEASGLEWERPGCLDIFWVVRGASPTVLTMATFTLQLLKLKSDFFVYK